MNNMKLVYIISKGIIESYQLLKITNNFFIIDFDGHRDKVPKCGRSNKLGGVMYTTDILKASIEAQRQINIIHEYIDNLQVELFNAEQKLFDFNEEHTNE